MDFVKFEEALSKLGISAERLNQLREDGELRAYRDGASWKFRADEIDKLASEGVPDSPPPSDIGLPRLDELVDARDLGDLSSLEDDDLKLADEQSELELGLGDLDLEDTVTAGVDDKADVVGDLEPSSDPSDSILLSDETLGESPAAPSTIIGRKELASKDVDLELVTDDDASASDVKLAAGASNVLTPGVAGSGVLDDIAHDSGNAAAFADLEELEIDLAAESSRVLNLAEAAELREKVAASKNKPPTPDSDLELADLELAGEDEGTDPVPEAAEAPKPKTQPDEGPTSDLQLATDEDDFVLAGEGGSDITLDSADSGINLVDPSDSGLALDDIPLEAGGSAILDSLSGVGLGKATKPKKGPAESELSLVGGDSDIGGGAAAAEIQTDDDFRLTPMGDVEEDADSSSQVIAIDAGGLDDLGAGEGGILGDDAFAEDTGEGVALSEDYEGAGVGELAAAGYAPVARAEGEYTLWNILGLTSAMILLVLSLIVTMDLIRNVSSWNDNLALNDSMLEGILGLFGLR